MGTRSGCSTRLTNNQALFLAVQAPPAGSPSVLALALDCPGWFESRMTLSFFSSPSRLSKQAFRSPSFPDSPLSPSLACGERMIACLWARELSRRVLRPWLLAVACRCCGWGTSPRLTVSAGPFQLKPRFCPLCPAGPKGIEVSVDSYLVTGNTA